MSTENTTPATPANTGRDEKGRFTQGNQFGRGNPHARQVAALRAEMMQTISPVEIRILFQTAMSLALKGSVAALKLILQYTMGKPLAGVDPDRLDVHEFECLKAKSIPIEHVNAPLDDGTMPVELANRIVGAAQQTRQASLAAMACDALTSGTLPDQYEEEDDEEDFEAEGEPQAIPLPRPCDQRTTRTSAAANRAESTPVSATTPIAPQRPSTPMSDPRDSHY